MKAILAIVTMVMVMVMMCAIWMGVCSPHFGVHLHFIWIESARRQREPNEVGASCFMCGGGGGRGC